MDLFERLKSIGRRVHHELRVYQLVLKDRRTPPVAKVLLGGAVGYTLLPFDIIPDVLPVIDHLDDLIIVPALIIIALQIIPTEVIEDSRRLVKGENYRCPINSNENPSPQTKPIDSRTRARR